MKDFFRNLVFPGLDLHTRNRASLQQYWKIGPRDVLDAGSGNGYLSWLAYKSGASVVGLNVEPDQVRRASEFLIGYRRANPERLRFEQCNLYDLAKETRTFDEIICFEVLEHLRNDALVVKEFYRILRPGGMLHLCAPNRMHQRHQTENLDLHETGGHVRPGYTEEDYRRLLEPVGFCINCVVGIGPKPLYLADKVLRGIRGHFGDLAALPLLLFALPTVWFAKFNPKTPFSIYVRAVKFTR